MKTGKALDEADIKYGVLKNPRILLNEWIQLISRLPMALNCNKLQAVTQTYHTRQR